MNMLLVEKVMDVLDDVVDLGFSELWINWKTKERA